jgi:DnaK suppressor protein
MGKPEDGEGKIMDDESQNQEAFFEECKSKLMVMRQERLNAIGKLGEALVDKVEGDEGDMAQVLQNQHMSLTQKEKVLRELREIDEALERLEDGSYGICEETEEEIEWERLRAIPWTRLSLEGAEIREKSSKKYARHG